MIQLPKGTKDILPDEMYKWKYFYRKIEEICRSYRIEEIKTPVFEYTELFQHLLMVLVYLNILFQVD